MKIRYIHEANPYVVKTYDTAESLRKTPFIFSRKSQSEWDKQEIQKMRHDKKTGLILEFEIIKE